MASSAAPETTAASRLQLISGSASKRRLSDRGIIHAKSEEGDRTWSHTTLLSFQYGHPEILLVGLDPFLANSVLSFVTEQVAQGTVYEAGSQLVGALHRLTCSLRAVTPAAASILMPSLGTRPVHQRVLQLVYPDSHNRLPWHPEYQESWRAMQPLFLAGQPLGKVEGEFLKAAMHRPLQEDRRHPGHSALFVRTST